MGSFLDGWMHDKREGRRNVRTTIGIIGMDDRHGGVVAKEKRAAVPFPERLASLVLCSLWQNPRAALCALRASKSCNAGTPWALSSFRSLSRFCVSVFYGILNANKQTIWLAGSIQVRVYM